MAYFKIVFSLLLLHFCGYLSPLLAAENEPLVFLNWADYMDPELLQEFQQQTGIEVKEVYYASDEARDELLASNQGKGYDLMLVSGFMLESYVGQGWLSPLPKPLPASMKTIDPRWLEVFPVARSYAAPYFWGTLGIAYRSDLVITPMTSWKHFFEPDKSISGKLTLMDSGREVVGMALKSLGYSANSTDGQALNEALVLMHDQGPSVGSYSYVDLDETSSLLSGETWAAMMYSGDALMLQEHNDNIEYVLPSEGGNIWVDYLTISASSTNKDAALQLIEFLNQPKIAARLAEYVYCAPPNLAAHQYLSEEFLGDETIFPNATALASSEFFNQMPPRLLRRLTKSFQQLVD